MSVQGLSKVDIACIEAVRGYLPDRVPSNDERTTSGYESENPLRRLFDDKNIFTEGGVGFVEGRETVLRLKFRIMQLLADLFPESEIDESSLHVLGMGSFNIVVAVKLQHKAQRRDSAVGFSARVSRFLGIPPRIRKFALRIPRDKNGDMDGPPLSDVAGDIVTQRVISSCLGLPIPKIEKYDLGRTNALGRPYTLQTLLPGKNLHALWLELNPKQKASAIQQITQTVEKIAAVTTPAAGFISLSNLTSGSSAIALDQFPVPTNKEAKKRPHFAQPSQSPAPPQTPFGYLMDHCQRWQKYEEEIGRASRNKNLWRITIAVAKALDRRGWLGQRFHLTHGDLFPRNILAKITGPETVEITGIVDWDMACFAPKFVALRPPFWAWAGHSMDERDEDLATYEPPEGKFKTLKQAFRGAASEEFIVFGLSRESAIARKLFRVVNSGLLGDRRHLALQLAEEWNGLHPEDKIGDLEAEWN
ncbi:uncharacterized protein J4E78_008615 [Alternaria triticimaculans]|uniref:uncharacterized protein n=1 Tax=Alternaria triticimaculans TaxID=297637 RepID=UPI0020C261B1|nr:uncharacterized protein J4E78_008615 [Alternaria triticimaculans]KAI4648552.1 hypothetical protein J4E78_008615 [Alternaria triticimaculans]